LEKHSCYNLISFDCFPRKIDSCDVYIIKESAEHFRDPLSQNQIVPNYLFKLYNASLVETCRVLVFNIFRKLTDILNEKLSCFPALNVASRPFYTQLNQVDYTRTYLLGDYLLPCVSDIC
jgi:hypothetical protein